MSAPVDPNASVPAQSLVGAEAAFFKFLPAALNLSSSQVRPYRANVYIALHNTQHGVKSLRDRAATIASTPHDENALRDAARRLGVDLDACDEVLELASAVAFAVSAHARLAKREPSSLRESVSRASKLRRLLLHSLQACADADVIDPQLIAGLRLGHGHLDLAQDCIDAVGIFRGHAAVLEHKTPLTEQLLQEAHALGTALILAIKPQRMRVKRQPRPQVVEAANKRDRLWSLLRIHHETYLWKPGAHLFGKDVSVFVPPLKACQLPKRKPKASTEHQ